jgi:hypothetical protein
VYLRHLSSSAYEMVRTTGLLHLPSQRTLRDYTYYTEACHGFSASVDQQLRKVARIESCRLMEQYVVLIMDEMHIREDLVYDKHTGIAISRGGGGHNPNLSSYSQRKLPPKTVPLALFVNDRSVMQGVLWALWTLEI